MDITDDMLQAAVRKAIEAGLLPRNAYREDAEGSKELMRTIVQAAMSASAQSTFHDSNLTYERHPAGTAFSVAPGTKRAVPVYAYS